MRLRPWSRCLASRGTVEIRVPGPPRPAPGETRPKPEHASAWDRAQPGRPRQEWHGRVTGSDTLQMFVVWNRERRARHLRMKSVGQEAVDSVAFGCTPRPRGDQGGQRAVLFIRNSRGRARPGNPSPEDRPRPPSCPVQTTPPPGHMGTHDPRLSLSWKRASLWAGRTLLATGSLSHHFPAAMELSVRTVCPEWRVSLGGGPPPEQIGASFRQGGCPQNSAPLEVRVGSVATALVGSGSVDVGWPDRL